MPTYSDVVYTPEWCAADMVQFFRPHGRILEPCKGKGVFLKFLPPETMWCEIEEGVDFFKWTDPVDWLVSNPPYSKTREWLRHSYTLAHDILYLVPLRNITSGYGCLKEIYQFGGFKHIRLYGTGGKLNFPMGNAVSAIHIQKNYKGPTGFSFYEDI